MGSLLISICMLLVALSCYISLSQAYDNWQHNRPLEASPPSVFHRSQPWPHYHRRDPQSQLACPPQGGHRYGWGRWHHWNSPPPPPPPPPNSANSQLPSPNTDPSPPLAVVNNPATVTPISSPANSPTDSNAAIQPPVKQPPSQLSSPLVPVSPSSSAASILHATVPQLLAPAQHQQPSSPSQTLPSALHIPAASPSSQLVVSALPPSLPPSAAASPRTMFDQPLVPTTPLPTPEHKATPLTPSAPSAPQVIIAPAPIQILFSPSQAPAVSTNANSQQSTGAATPVPSPANLKPTTETTPAPKATPFLPPPEAVVSPSQAPI